MAIVLNLSYRASRKMVLRSGHGTDCMKANRERTGSKHSGKGFNRSDERCLIKADKQTVAELFAVSWDWDSDREYVSSLFHY